MRSIKIRRFYFQVLFTSILCSNIAFGNKISYSNKNAINLDKSEILIADTIPDNSKQTKPNSLKSEPKNLPIPNQQLGLKNFKIQSSPAGEEKRTFAQLQKEASVDKPLTLNINGGKLLVYLKAGCYSFSKENLSTDLLRLWVNDNEPIRNAKVIQKENNKLTIENKADGLNVQISFSINKLGELNVQPTMYNATKQPILLKQMVTASGSYKKSFSGDELNKLRFFKQHFHIWGAENPGHFALNNEIIHSFYLGVLFSPEKGKALTIAYQPNILWTSCVQANGKNQTMMAFTDFGKNPFNMYPGRKESFDTAIISFNDGLVNALLNYGNKFKPHQPINHEKMAANNGWNSWEFFKSGIGTEILSPVLDSMSNLNKLTSNFPAFVIDGGYFKYHGKYVAIPRKFPEGMINYADSIKKAGLKPGIWMTPSFVDPEVLAEINLPSFEHPFNKTIKTRIFDPSDEKSNQYFLKQLKTFVDAGYSYFKLDFLATAYRIDRDYGSSDYAPERVLREYYQKIRNTMGEKAFWLACGSVPIPLVGLADAARTGPDIAANWERSRGGIFTKLSPNFWMHGNLFWSDADFLVVAGEGYTKPGELIIGEKTKGVSKDSGYTKDEANTWANYLVVTGGMLTWSDNPSTISKEGIEIVKNTFKHGTGNMGVPLDYEQNNMPAKWVRKEKDCIYIGLFNWDNKPAEVSINSAAISELKSAKSGIDILTNEIYKIESGQITTTLRPHASICIRINK